jgi:DNA polymerase elongation subunit (family B)
MYFGGRSLCIFDIETTGLYPRRDQLILSGLISIDNNLATVTQYFAEDPSQEKAVVDATLKQLALSDVIITYNGRSFDLPFLQARAKRYRLPAPASFCDLDLYTVLRYHSDLKDMLGIDPLSVRVLPAGTLKAYRERYGEPIRKINCDKSDEVCLLRLVDELGEEAVK